MIRWNPKDYDNVQVIRLPIQSIWYPDLFLYNAADSGKLTKN